MSTLKVTFARPKVLIVDDDPVFRKAMARLLRELPIDIELAHSGAAALAAVVDTDFALVLSDVEMHPMDGVELVAELRGMQVEVPVVFVSGCDPAEIELRLARRGLSGAVPVVSKPVSRNELVELIQQRLALVAPALPPPPPVRRDA
ncbi:MAG: response regulator [Kofleriaceae bacterium]